jgi:hypothetical protein
MRRLLASLLLAGAALAPLVPLAASPAQAEEEYMIVPEAGLQTDTFTVVGRGMQPGIALDINFVSPEGNVYTLGSNVVVVGPDGTFRYDFVPAERFAGSSTGTWIVHGCVAGTDDCDQGTFEIR